MMVLQQKSSNGGLKTDLRNEPLLPNKFWVETDHKIEGFFTDCSGLQIQTEVMEYKEGGVNNHVHKLPGRTSFSNLTLKRGLTISSEFWEWYMATVNGRPNRRSMSIILYSGQAVSEQVRRWDIRDAYPIKWIGPEFKATEKSNYAIESIEIVHSGFTMLKI